jgi:peroxiredoxin Q/BCP
MSRWWWLLLAIPVLGWIGYRMVTAETHLRVGESAPDFSLLGSDGKTHRLSDLRGKFVVLAWYPRAFTPGCTSECKSLAESGKQLDDLNIAYFAASTDTAEKNRDFAKSLGASYPILSDPTGTAAAAYGVKTPLGIASRVTFIIDQVGIIRDIEPSVESADHAGQIAGKVKELGLASPEKK